MSEPEVSEFERGVEAGRVAQILTDHGKHFDGINGSIEKTAAEMAAMRLELQGLREDARLREERENVKAKTVAAEVERRRQELADTLATGDRAFTRREKLLGSALGVAAVAVAVATNL